MKIKTDNAALVGKHVFEVAGLGKAPYQFKGVFEQHSNCHYCGTFILYNFMLKSADGKDFIVGSDCINKSGDYGLIEAYKTSPEFRAMQAAKAKAKDDAVVAQINAIFAAPEYAVKLAVPVSHFSGTQGGKFKYILRGCGASGRVKWLKALKAYVALPVTDADITAIQAAADKVAVPVGYQSPYGKSDTHQGLIAHDEYQSTKPRVAITGKTYPVKEALKALGGKWDGYAKAWMVPADKADEARALVK